MDVRQDMEIWHLHNANQAWSQGAVAEEQLQANGWRASPVVPPPFRGIKLHSILNYDGPSLMDGVLPEGNTVDDGIDAWTEHVAEVEIAGERILEGSI